MTHGLSDVTAQGNIAWLTGKCQYMHNMHLVYNKTIVDICFGKHGVLLSNKLNHIDLCCPVTFHDSSKISK